MSEAYKFEPHDPKPRRTVPWPICAKCGLVFLKNDFTAWCVRLGCHPGYRAQRDAAGRGPG